jgi:polysaccharide biosynthesis protein PelD
MADFFSAYPHCPPQFAQELNKLLLLKKRLNIDSGLVAIAVAKELRPHNVIYSLQQQQRILDCTWVTEQGNFDVLISLLPLTDGPGIQGYLQRLAEYLKMHLSLDMDQKAITSRFLQLSPDSARGMMQKFLTYAESSFNNNSPLPREGEG